MVVVVVAANTAGGSSGGNNVNYDIEGLILGFLQDSNRIPVSFDDFDYDIVAEHVSTEPVMAANLKQTRINSFTMELTEYKVAITMPVS